MWLALIGVIVVGELTLAALNVFDLLHAIGLADDAARGI